MVKVQHRETETPESHEMQAKNPATAAVRLERVEHIFHRGFQAIRLRQCGRTPAFGFRPLQIGLLVLAFGMASMGQSPALTRPAPGSVLTASSVTFTWTTVSNATSYELKLGSIPENFGHLGIYTAGRTSASTISVRARGLPTNGKIVYADLTWVISGRAYNARYAYIAAYRGTSADPVIGSFSCTPGSFTGSGTGLCTVKLNSAAGKGGIAIALASSESAAVVPNSLKVPAGGRDAIFKAEVSAVLRTQTVVLMATDGKSSRTFPIKLNDGSSVLELESRSIAFGSVILNSISTQSLRLNSTGRKPLVIDSAKIAGKGFRLSGTKLPMTLDPSKFLTLDVEFDPTAVGRASGTLTVVSNSVTGSSTVIPLSGTGQKGAYEVRLTWDAPSGSPVSIAGYRVYRAIYGSSRFGLLNDSLDPGTSYIDDSVDSGVEYVYYVETVDKVGISSVPSRSFSIAIP